MSKAVDLVTATAVWAGIGYGLDRWLGTWPALFAVGAVIGNFTGIYVLYRRSIEEGKNAQATTGVSRTWPKRSVPARGEAGSTSGDDE